MHYTKIQCWIISGGLIISLFHAERNQKKMHVTLQRKSACTALDERTLITLFPYVHGGRKIRWTYKTSLEHIPWRWLQFIAAPGSFLEKPRRRNIARLMSRVRGSSSSPRGSKVESPIDLTRAAVPSLDFRFLGRRNSAVRFVPLGLDFYVFRLLCFSDFFF